MTVLCTITGTDCTGTGTEGNRMIWRVFVEPNNRVNPEQVYSE